MNKLFALLLFLTGGAYATTESFVKKANIGRLQKELIVGGSDVKYITCSGSVCIIHFGPGGESSTVATVISDHVYIDPLAVFDDLELRMKVLAVKLRSNTITDTERDELLDRMLQHMGF